MKIKLLLLYQQHNSETLVHEKVLIRMTKKMGVIHGIVILLYQGVIERQMVTTVIWINFFSFSKT